MKKLVFISGAASISLTLLGAILKIFHFPGGSILTIVGLTMFALVFIPCCAKYWYDRID